MNTVKDWVLWDSADYFYHVKTMYGTTFPVEQYMTLNRTAPMHHKHDNKVLKGVYYSNYSKRAWCRGCQQDVPKKLLTAQLMRIKLRIIDKEKDA